jgi:hypothetical protein
MNSDKVRAAAESRLQGAYESLFCHPLTCDAPGTDGRLCPNLGR